MSGDGRVEIAQRRDGGLIDKFQRAYRWISEQAILPTVADLEFGPSVKLAQGELTISLHEQESFSSFILLPLLTLMTSRRMVFVGAPGRGKTSVAVLMSLLAGYPLEQVRRAVQHGHPQLTIGDLLGSPLPSDLVQAKSAQDIRVSWRDWITLRVKVIDEYNRIPTKTQSALLSLMAEGYAELYEQLVESGNSAWYLTANDEMGGGTFPVIEALKDRIDVVVRCTPFHSQHLGVLAERIASASSAEQFVPDDLIFTAAQLDEVDREIRAVPVPNDVLDLLGFFLGQLDFCRRASDQLEFMNKDTLHLANRRVAHVCTEDCPLDKQLNLCSQTENGVSPRTYQSIIHYGKALAWFRGAGEVTAETLRQLLPWTLFDKLHINPQSAFFQKAENKVYLIDRAAWIRQMFDRALQQHAAYQKARKPLLELQLGCTDLDSLNAAELKHKSEAIRKAIQELVRRNELNGPTHEDLVRLKGLHSRCRAAMARRGGAK
ncbi:MAG: AAA family ATPase [Planctomycetes bacterium]|nr:AAA family ATPase [Planctomycetota bacterium]